MAALHQPVPVGASEQGLLIICLYNPGRPNTIFPCNGPDIERDPVTTVTKRAT